MRIFKRILFVVYVISSNIADAQNQPSVIIIITDDQGYGDIGAHGNEVIKTPHLDKMYAQSIRLTNFHAGTTCAPSRSGLMSGVEGHRAGVWHTVGGCNMLREKYIAMPQVFKDNGYATAIFGKWHLGDAYPYLPENRGFEEVVCHGAGGIGQTPDYWNNDYFDDTYMHNGKPQKYRGYCTDVFFREALDYIESKKNEPFFVYISTNAPHGPLNVPEKYYNIYKNEIRITAEQKAYYGMISNIDDNIGKLGNKLQQLGLKDNTIVIFTTDNGTASGYKIIKGQEYGYNAGMKGNKGSAYDGGHRVPFFIQWNKGGFKGGVDVDKMIMNYDILPTLVDLCSLEKSVESEYDGVSVKSLLTKTGEKWPKRYAVVDKNKSQHPKKWKQCAVMDDEWRLINGKELYNIKEDNGQEDNIADRYPEKVKVMRDYYEKWWTGVSQEFDVYEAYKIGAPGFDETVFTIHDMHSDNPLPYSQEYVRDPFSGKRSTLTKTAYWMINVVQSGEYEIALSRWPRESGLRFKEVPKRLGTSKSWCETRPDGVNLDIQKANIKVKGNSQEQKVDRNAKEVVFKTKLLTGRQQFKASFINSKDKNFGAFYVYFKKVR